MCRIGEIETPRRFGVELEGYVSDKDMYGNLHVGGLSWDVDDDGSLDSERDSECGRCEGEGKEECPRCDGSGSENCEDCGGSGSETCVHCDGEGGKVVGYDDEDEEIWEDCPHCDDGEVDCSNCDSEGNQECGRCDGSGNIDCRSCNGEGSHGKGRYGVEVKSPPIENTAPLYAIYDHLHGEDWYVDSTAGLHIHVEVADYEPADFRKLLALLVGIEPFIYSVTDDARHGNGYCQPLSQCGGNVLEVLRKKEINYKHEVEFTSDRYFGFNLDAYSAWRKTVEFRYFAAQDSARHVEAYVELMTKIVEFAKHATYQQVLAITSQLLDCDFDEARNIIIEVLQLVSGENLVAESKSIFDSHYNRNRLNKKNILDIVSHIEVAV